MRYNEMRKQFPLLVVKLLQKRLFGIISISCCFLELDRGQSGSNVPLIETAEAGPFLGFLKAIRYLLV